MGYILADFYNSHTGRTQNRQGEESQLKVTVELFGTLAKNMSRKKVELTLPEGATMSTLIEQMVQSHGKSFEQRILTYVDHVPWLTSVILLNERSVKAASFPDIKLNDGDVVQVIPHVAGG